MKIVTYRLIVTGLGNVGRSFLGVLRSQESLLRDRYGVAFSVVGAADSGGAASDPTGLDCALILATKRGGQSVAGLAGAGRTDVVVQLQSPRPGQARRAMFAAFAAVSLVKRVTVVDADIDPWDAAAVDWARMNRMKLERDLLLIPQAGTDRSEPMEGSAVSSRTPSEAQPDPEKCRQSGSAATEPRTDVGPHIG